MSSIGKITGTVCRLTHNDGIKRQSLLYPLGFEEQKNPALKDGIRHKIQNLRSLKQKTDGASRSSAQIENIKRQSLVNYCIMGRIRKERELWRPKITVIGEGVIERWYFRWVLSIPFFISCIRQQNPLTVLSKIILRKVKQFNLPPQKK